MIEKSYCSYNRCCLAKIPASRRLKTFPCQVIAGMGTLIGSNVLLKSWSAASAETFGCVGCVSMTHKSWRDVEQVKSGKLVKVKFQDA